MAKFQSTLPLAAYVRVSTAGQAASGVGLSAQRHALEQAAASQGFTIAGFYEDPARSGAKLSGRPGLQAALDEIAAGRAGGLAVAKVDRLGRSYEVMTLVERASREGWRLLALDIGLDTSTAEGEMVAGALTMAARFEWRRISQRQVDKHDQLRREGRRRGREAVPVEIADRIIELRGTGLSYQKIAKRLEAERVPTARGGRWASATVRSAEITRRREIAAQAA
jgi:DNA invertase Pin-like site-specific DNA recombinase